MKLTVSVSVKALMRELTKNREDPSINVRGTCRIKGKKEEALSNMDSACFTDDICELSCVTIPHPFVTD